MVVHDLFLESNLAFNRRVQTDFFYTLGCFYLKIQLLILVEFLPFFCGREGRNPPVAWRSIRCNLVTTESETVYVVNHRTSCSRGYDLAILRTREARSRFSNRRSNILRFLVVVLSFQENVWIVLSKRQQPLHHTFLPAHRPQSMKNVRIVYEWSHGLYQGGPSTD